MICTILRHDWLEQYLLRDRTAIVLSVQDSFFPTCGHQSQQEIDWSDFRHRNQSKNITEIMARKDDEVTNEIQANTSGNKRVRVCRVSNQREFAQDHVLVNTTSRSRTPPQAHLSCINAFWQVKNGVRD